MDVNIVVLSYITVLRSTNASILGYASQNIFHPFHVTFGRITLLGWRPSTSLPFSSLSWASTCSRTSFGIHWILDLIIWTCHFHPCLLFECSGGELLWLATYQQICSSTFQKLRNSNVFGASDSESHCIAPIPQKRPGQDPLDSSWDQQLSAGFQHVPLATLFGAY